MINKVLRTIKTYNMLDASDDVVLGLSGGADSVALFHILRKIENMSITAVHVNHGLRADEADGDERFCAELCNKYGIEIEIYRFDINAVAAEQGRTCEEAGREMRYKAFHETMERKKARKIAVAHNENDLAETVLMRLFRGAGLKGLAGIPPVRGPIIRPLIHTGRSEIEQYCRANGYEFRTDSTNGEDCYTRNSIRNSLLPQIERRYNPSVVRALARTAKMAAQENAFLDSLADAAYVQCVMDNGRGLDINALMSFDDVIKRRVVRTAFNKLNNSLKDIELDDIERILRLADGQSGKKVIVSKGVAAERQFGKLILGAREEPDAFCYMLGTGGEAYIKEVGMRVTVSDTELSGGIVKRFDRDKLQNGVCLRTRLPGDMFCPSDAGGKKLKDYLIDRKIARAERDKLFYAADGRDIMWIVGDRASQRYLADKNTENVIYIRISRE